MSESHSKRILHEEQAYVDPASKQRFKVGDEVRYCPQSRQVFLEKSLSSYDGKCPYCGFQITPSTYTPASPKEKPSLPSPTPSRVPAFVIGLFFISVLCVGAIFLFNGINNPPHPTPVPTQKIVSSPDIAFTSTSLPIVTKTITSTPPPIVTETSIPTPSPLPGLYTDPEQFIRWYFNAVWQDRNYEYLWSFLTPSFRSHASQNDFKSYEDWWNSVDKIDFHSFQKTQHDSSYVTVRIDVTFYLKDGRVLSHRKYAYDLIFNNDKNSWMFDYR